MGKWLFWWYGVHIASLRKLGVKNPNYITRVTEYVPEIIAFIEKIISNGYGYESNKSVYFDIKAFEAKNFKYGKLKRMK